MAAARSRHSPPAVWISLLVLAALSLGFALAAARTQAPDITASGPVVSVPRDPAPAPLPDVKPQGAS